MIANFFEGLLSLTDNWKVEKVEFDSTTKEIDIYVKFDLNSYKKECISEYYGLHDYGNYRRWRHLDILQYKTFIKAKIPRLKNKFGEVKAIRVPWAEAKGRYTHLFESKVIDTLLATKNQTKTGELLQCSFNVVNRIMHRATERGLKKRGSDTIYTQLSIDEKSFKKGHNYVSVLSNPDTGLIVDVSEGRTKKSCKELLNNNLTDFQKSKVDRVSLDMWEAYINTVKEELPKSDLVHDRFHLIQYLNKAVDQVRRREVKTQEVLKNSRYALLKNTYNLTVKQYFKFEDVLHLNTQVSYAWRLKECFKSLFNCSSYEEACSRYSDWSSFCLWEDILEITRVVKTFSNHMKGVCNALTQLAVSIT